MKDAPLQRMETPEKGAGLGKSALSETGSTGSQSAMPPPMQMNASPATPFSALGSESNEEKKEA